MSSSSREGLSVPRAALAHVFNDSGYRATSARLPPADKAALRALAQGVSDLHSLPARNRLGEELGLGKAVLEYGQYQIHDEGFVEWLRQLELEE